MKKLLLLSLFVNSLCAQTVIHLSNGFDAVKELDSTYFFVRKKLGKPDKIVKDKIDQPFCGMTLGRDLHYIYRNFGVNISGRKRLGYVNKIGKGEDYYNIHCHMHSCVISGKSKLIINDNLKINTLDTLKLKAAFGKPVKIERDEVDVEFDETCKLTVDVKRLLRFYKGDLIGYSYQDNLSKSWFNFYFFPKGKLCYIEVSDSEP